VHQYKWLHIILDLFAHNFCTVFPLISRPRKEEIIVTGEIFVMRSLQFDDMKENEVDSACGTCGGQERCIHGCGEDT
jgi:hypothetical protein